MTPWMTTSCQSPAVDGLLDTRPEECEFYFGPGGGTRVCDKYERVLISCSDVTNLTGLSCSV